MNIIGHPPSTDVHIVWLYYLCEQSTFIRLNNSRGDVAASKIDFSVNAPRVNCNDLISIKVMKNSCLPFVIPVSRLFLSHCSKSLM